MGGATSADKLPRDSVGASSRDQSAVNKPGLGVHHRCWQCGNDVGNNFGRIEVAGKRAGNSCCGFYGYESPGTGSCCGAEASGGGFIVRNATRSCSSRTRKRVSEERGKLGQDGSVDTEGKQEVTAKMMAYLLDNAKEPVNKEALWTRRKQWRKRLEIWIWIKSRSCKRASEQNSGNDWSGQSIAFGGSTARNEGNGGSQGGRRNGQCADQIGGHLPRPASCGAVEIRTSQVRGAGERDSLRGSCFCCCENSLVARIDSFRFLIKQALRTR